MCVFFSGGGEEWRGSITGTEAYSVKKSKTDATVNCLPLYSRARIFAATWNVGGKSPPSNLNLDDWLHTSPAADIYVLGYVPHPCASSSYLSSSKEGGGEGIQSSPRSEVVSLGISGFRKLYLSVRETPSDYGSSDDENISGDYSPGTAAYCSPVSYGGYGASSSLEDRERAGHSR
ncbi:hypothetical protein B296_00025894 [Ensete ventricosum]|uniref:Inositol polyphosphate-related phosphatase domain-containing protein n=1 Tax=Ensete ventricosum TaxID=4639 RepID=A0A426Z7A7_ENSVE|nr:hypothetical protein B296_00025894 [Ensete ventricosum]